MNAADYLRKLCGEYASIYGCNPHLVELGINAYTEYHSIILCKWSVAWGDPLDYCSIPVILNDAIDPHEYRAASSIGQYNFIAPPLPPAIYSNSTTPTAVVPLASYPLLTLRYIDSNGDVPQAAQCLKCECGSDKAGSPAHSSWCPKHS